MGITGGAEQRPGRIVYLDLLRIIACFFVIVNHTIPKIYKVTELSGLWLASIFYLFLSKAAVPVFVMISGYTMLNRQDSHAKSFRRLFRYSCTLVLFSGVYFVSQYLAGEWPPSLRFFLDRLTSGTITNAFWYMYLYLGILIMIPFLQKLVSVLDKSDFLIYFGWSFSFYAVWPMVAHFFPEMQLTEYFTLPLFNSYIALMLAGCYFRRYCTPSRRWRIPCIVVYLGTVILNVFLTVQEYLQNGGVNYLFFDNREFLPIIIGAFCLVGLISTIPVKEPFASMITKIGGLTFGIYLMSDLVIDKTEFLYRGMLQHQIPAMLAMLVYEIAVFVICAAIVAVLKKLPVLEKLL